ncbi:MAG: metallophosphoesterase family protein [Candidatus Woesearchaeota archaeon]
MKILFFTDTHGNTRQLNEVIEKSHDAELIVCPGDLTIFENGLDEILRMLNAIGKPIIVLHGNHESYSSMASISLRYKNIHFIHKSYYIYKDLIFLGYGGGGFAITDSGFDKVMDILMKEYERLCKKDNVRYRIILVTHAPPHGTMLDDMGDGRMEWHVGCKNFTEFIKREQPIIAVSGHIHETFELQEKIGKTLIFNPGPRGRIIDMKWFE